jgi:hypothetical protein
MATMYPFGSGRGANQNYGLNNTTVGNDPNWWRGSAGAVGHWNYPPQEETIAEDVVYPNAGQRFPLDPNWEHQLEMQKLPPRGNIDNRWSDRITSPVMGILQAVGDKFQLPEAKQRAYESIMDTGTYKGNPYTLYDTPSGLKIGSDIIGYGQGYAKNFDSMFGSKSIEDMEQKKVDWALGRLDKFKDDEENLGISKRLYNALIKRGIIDSSGNRITTPAGADTVTTTTTGGSTTPNVHGGGSEASFTQRSPGGISQAVSRAARTDQRGNVMSGWNLAEGGRAGYQEGELVDEDVNIQGPGFDVNENVMMASNEWNERLLENLFEKYLDLGFSPVEAEKLALEEFESMSQAPQEEVVEEGIASLV